MKNKHLFASLLTTLSLTAAAGPSAFAAAPYGMEYTGGEPLGTANVQINPNLVSGLTTLMKNSGIEVTVSNSAKVQHDYIWDANRCLPYMYVAVSNGEQISPSDGITYTISNDQYVVKAKLNKVIADNVPEDKKIVIGMTEGQTYIWGGYNVYEDATCSSESKRQDIVWEAVAENMRIFGEFNITLYKKSNLADPFVTKGLYFGITDIDAAQSYKILNSDNALIKGNMYALNAEGLQKQGDDGPYPQNMYVASGNYIYSENKVGDTWGGVGLPSTANIYTVLNNNTQAEGLDIVFGFAGTAASGIEYYAPQLKISYTSDEHGEITGKTTEQIIVDDNPSGSSAEANEGYNFSHWIADVDVKLTDGTEIPAGSPLTDAQVKKVVVRDDIVFTAIYKAIPEEPEEDTPAVPDTGAVTGETNGTLIATSILGIAIAALVVATMPRLLKKRVHFIKK